MQTIKYGLPIFEDNDVANLNQYSNLMANAIKTQLEDSEDKIQDITETQTSHNTKITNLETDNTTNKQDITNIKQQQTTQNTNIERNSNDIETNKTNIIELEKKHNKEIEELESLIPTRTS